MNIYDLKHFLRNNYKSRIYYSVKNNYNYFTEFISAEDLELIVEGDKIIVPEMKKEFSFKQLEKEIKEKEKELELKIIKDKKRRKEIKEKMKKKYNKHIEDIEKLIKLNFKYFVITEGTDWEGNPIQEMLSLQDIIDKELKELFCNRTTNVLLENIDSLSKGKEIKELKLTYKLK